MSSIETCYPISGHQSELVLNELETMLPGRLTRADFSKVSDCLPCLYCDSLQCEVATAKVGCVFVNFVRCCKCGAQGPVTESIGRAMSCWNRLYDRLYESIQSNEEEGRLNYDYYQPNFT